MAVLVSGSGGGGKPYTGVNPLTIGQEGYTYPAKTLLKDGLQIINGVNGDGQFVWKQLTAEGGEFVAFVTADDVNSYPNGGTQDGYWYELVEEGFSLELLGCTKYAVDTFSFTSDTFASNATLHHSLGGIPKFIYISTDYTHSDYLSSSKTYIKEGIFFSKGITNSSSTGNAYGVVYNIGAYGGEQLVGSDGEYITDTTLSTSPIGANDKVAIFKAGATYAIISMA